MTDDFITRRTEWLHALPPAQVDALRLFRRAARRAYSSDPMATAYNVGIVTDSDNPMLTEAIETVRGMPVEFVVTL